MFGSQTLSTYTNGTGSLFGQSSLDSSSSSDWNDAFYTLSSGNDYSKSSSNVHVYDDPNDYVRSLPSQFYQRTSQTLSPAETLAKLDPVEISFNQARFDCSSPTDSHSSIDTPTSAESTPYSIMASQLSRDNSSAGTSFSSTPIDMLRIDSHVSNCPDVRTREDSLISSSHVKLESANSHFFSSPAVFVSADCSFSAPYGAHTTPYSQSISQSDLVEGMQRSTSHQSASSGCSSTSRSSQRKQEILASAARPIAPKGATDTDTSMTRASSQHKMVRIKSSDGSSKEVAQISKAPYVRPQHPKTICPYCNEYPDGFRGEHELRRHVERKHAKVKKVWVTVDASENQMFLANCKQCRNKKQYGAYYNAAAHLRRAHFHPRKRGRKAKHDSEKRGGKGGGDDPPMDYLKQNWMKEIEVRENEDIRGSSRGNDTSKDGQDGQSPCQIPYNFTQSHVIDENGIPVATPQTPLPPHTPITPITSFQQSEPVVAIYPPFDASHPMYDFSAYNYNAAYMPNVGFPAFDYDQQFDPNLFNNQSQ